MLTKTDFVDLVPHAGDMCLLDGVVAWDGAKILDWYKGQSPVR